MRALLACFMVLTGMPCAMASSEAPGWMHALVSVADPAHEPQMEAVMLYSESILTVQAPGKMRRLERGAYRILRPGGASRATVTVHFDSQSPVLSLRGWTIPASGADYAVKDRDAIVAGVPGVEGGELVVDVRAKMLRLPAATPGSIVGYEFEQERRPYDMTDEWEFQDTVPVREARYTVQAPPGWTYKAFWLNHPESQPLQSSSAWTWQVSDIKAVRLENDMPPWRGIAGKMVLSLQPPQGQGGFRSWQEVGSWYLSLTEGRRVASPAIQQKVKELTASAPSVLEKMKVLAAYIQSDIRYVGIELGIGGVQPHTANDVFEHRYGDCKDKVTLLSSMLKEIGVDSYYVIINTARGAISASTPPNIGFNHAILAIQVPAAVDVSTMPAHLPHAKLGTLLFFDPTSTLVPLGSIPGALQANFGMLVSGDGGELIQLPQSATSANGVQRSAKLALDEAGLLHGDVTETWSGEGAAARRYELRSAAQDVDRIKPVESMLSHSLGTFEIKRAAVRYLRSIDRPLEWNYSFEAPQYAKLSGDLVLVRPRVFASYSSSLLETEQARQYPIEFSAPERNTDVFEIKIPAGYKADDIPPPVDADMGFASYHSSTKLEGDVLRYTRSFEVKELSVPVDRASELKRLYRIIVNDERMSAVLMRVR